MTSTELNNSFHSIDEAISSKQSSEQIMALFTTAKELIDTFEYDELIFNPAKYRYHIKKSSYLRMIGKLLESIREETIAQRYAPKLSAQTDQTEITSVDTEQFSSNTSLSNMHAAIREKFDKLKNYLICVVELSVINKLESLIQGYIVPNVQSYEQYTVLQQISSQIREILDLFKSRTINRNEDDAEIPVSSVDANLSYDTDVTLLDVAIDKCLDEYKLNFCQFLLLQNQNAICNILFSNIPLTHERINKHTKKLSLLFHPDRASDEKYEEDFREIFQIIMACKEDLLNELTRNGTICDSALVQQHIEEGRKLWEIARDYSRAQHGKWSQLKHLNADELRNYLKKDLSEHQKQCALLAYEQYRAAALALGKHGTTEERSELRRMMGIALYTAEEFLQAQIYIIASMFILTSETSVTQATKIEELQGLLEKFRGVNTTVSTSEQSQKISSSTSSTSNAETISTDRILSMAPPTTVSTVNGQSSALVLKAHVKKELRFVVLQQCLIKSKNKQIETSDELIQYAKRIAIQKSAIGVGIGGVASVSYESIAAGSAVGSVSGPMGACVGLAVGFSVVIGGLYLGLDFVKQNQNRFQEPKIREKLNDKFKKALEYYNQQMYGAFLEELAAEYWSKYHLFEIVPEDDKIEIHLNPQRIITVLLEHEFRPDGIAYLLNLIGEALLNKPELLRNERTKNPSLREPLQSTMNELALKLFSAVYASPSQLQGKAKQLDEQVKKRTLNNPDLHILDRWFRSHVTSHYSSYVYSIPKAYFNDALLTSFTARLEELSNIARLNCAIVNIIIGGLDNFEESQNIMLEIKRKQAVTSNHRFYMISQSMMQAIDDLLMAFGFVPKELVDPELLALESNLALENIKTVMIKNVAVNCENVQATLYAPQQLTKLCQLNNNETITNQSEFVEKVKQLYNDNTGEEKLTTDLLHMLTADGKNNITDWSNQYCCAQKWVLTVAHLPILTRIFNITIHTCYVGTNATYGHVFFANEKAIEENICLNSHLFVILHSNYKDIIGMFNTASRKLNYLYLQLSMIKTNQLKIDLYNQIATIHRLDAEFYEKIHRLKALPKWNDAKKNYRHILDLEPNNVTALLGFGRCLIMLSKWKKAIEFLRRTLNKYDTSSEAWYLFGLAQRKNSIYGVAKFAVQKALENNPNYEDAVNELKVINALMSEKMEDRLEVYCNMTIRNKFNRRDNYSDYNILTIDGGGIRGIMPAIWMSEIERRTNRSAASMFHMMAGTSTGAIIAAGLCTPKRDNVLQPRYQASDIVKLYTAHSHEVFQKPADFLYNLRRQFSQESKYVAGTRQKLFKNYFDHTRLSHVLTELVIPAVKSDYSKTTYLFNRYDCRAFTASDYEIQDVLMCTTAAPTYFDPYKLDDSSYVDGGVQMNNPVMAAYSEALRYGIQKDDLFLLSLGTGDYVPDPLHPDAKRHLLFYAMHQQEILNIILDGPQSNVDVHMQTVIPKGKYQRWQFWFEEPIALDATDESSIQILFENARAFFEEMDAYDNDKRLGLLLERLKGDVH